MPILISIGLLAVLFLWYNWGRAHARSELNRTLDPYLFKVFNRKKCQWHALGSSTTNLKAFRCKTCGVEAYSNSANGPKECKRNLRGGL